MTIFVLLLGLLIGVWVWVLQSNRIAQLIYSFPYLNIDRFNIFYDVFADSNYELIAIELKDLTSKPVSIKSHLKAVEMFRHSAYYAWRPYYLSELLKIIEATAIYLVLPALFYNNHIWVLLAGFIIGFGVPAAGRQLMGTGQNFSIYLFYRFLGEKAYAIYGIKMVADEALELEQAETASVEAAKDKNLKKAKNLAPSLKKLRKWRIFEWLWWTTDIIVILFIFSNSTYPDTYYDLPWFSNVANPLILTLLLQVLLFVPVYIFFRLYALGFIDKTKTTSKLHKITTKLRSSINE